MEIKQKAIRAGLHNKRELMLDGMPNGCIATLPANRVPSEQLQLDLSALNQVPFISGNQIPLERWLRNAAHQTAYRPDLQTFFREKADVVGNGVATEIMTEAVAIPTAVSDELAIVEEKIVHVDDKLPIDFLTKATTTAGSVARMLVPRHDGGQPTLSLITGNPRTYLGTGWVIGPRHVIRNHHVINARDNDEPDASQTDFLLQGQETKIQFDYNTEDAEGDIREVEAVQAFGKNLDYAVLKLTQDIGRPPLTLWDKPISLPSGDDAISVNIVQHPGDAPKQIALRNNLAAMLTDRDLAYFTDTEGSSTGSAVCTDGWHVIALHKASTKAHGDFEFQGKTTAWVNIGTRMDRLIEHFKDEHTGLWDEIKPE